MMSEPKEKASPGFFGRVFRRSQGVNNDGEETEGRAKWSMGVLNPKSTIEVPGESGFGNPSHQLDIRSSKAPTFSTALTTLARFGLAPGSEPQPASRLE